MSTNDAEAHHNLGAVRQSQGKLDEAIGHYREALRINFNYPEAHYNLGAALRAQGRIEEAIPHYRQALRVNPDWPPALIDLAWILATSADARIRQPDEALRLAERGVELTHPQTAAALDVLAATLAAVGQYERAVTTAQAALGLATGAHDEGTATGIRARLEVYKRGRPYREPN